MEPGASSAHAFPPFVGRAPWWGGDLQTLRNFVRGSAVPIGGGVHTERLTLPLADGSGDQLSASLQRPSSGGRGPLVVLVHGLGGDESSAYMQCTAAHLLGLGYRVLRLNLRGAGASRATCREQYHAGRSEDLRDALGALPPEVRGEGCVVVGYSLGANMLLKYLAEYGDVLGAVSVSAPIDLAAASQRMLEPRNRVYHWRLLSGMKREALAEGAAVSDEERRMLPGLASILEFDEKIVAPRNGFRGAQHYYDRCHARQYLVEIRVPTVVIYALDDPWIPADTYTSYDWRDNTYLVPLFASGGGHVGFHATGSSVPWHDRCIERFLTSFES